MYQRVYHCLFSFLPSAMTMPIHNASNITHLSDLGMGPCSTTFKAHTWLSQLTSLSTLSSISLHLAPFLRWSARYQPRCGIVQWLNGSNECYGEFIFRGLLVVPSLALSLIFYIWLYFLYQSGRHSHYSQWSLDHASVAQWNGKFIVRALLITPALLLNLLHLA